MAAGVMTLKQAAEYLQVHPTTIYRLMRLKQMPGFKIGADWRFLKADIDDWMIERVKEQGSVTAISRPRFRAAE